MEEQVAMHTAPVEGSQLQHLGTLWLREKVGQLQG
jgi:hypothetical protein